jgi:hypothetical protein
LLKPGYVLFGFGLLLSAMLSTGPFDALGIGFNLHWMLLGLTCATLGYSCIQIGVLTRIIHRLRPGGTRRVQEFLTYDRGMVLAAPIFAAGLILVSALVWQYVAHGLRLSSISHPAIMGLLLLILGFQTFCFTLLLEMTRRVIRKSGP